MTEYMILTDFLTPSGSLPLAAISMTASLPPGPASGTASLAALTARKSQSAGSDLLRLRRFSKCKDLWSGVPSHSAHIYIQEFCSFN